MKKFIAHILIIMMLVPALVCAMPFCSVVSEHKHTMSSEHCAHHKSAPADSVMLQADCVNMDMQIIKTAIQLEQPSSELYYVSIDDVLFFKPIMLPEQHANHHPPPNLAVADNPIYFTTQRFRI